MAIKDVVFLALQLQENVHERMVTRKTRTREQENPDNTWNPSPVKTEDLVQALECIQRNSLGSACPNIAKGLFASSEEVSDLLRRL